MNPKEQPPLSEVTPGLVYSKAREILDVYGQHGFREKTTRVPTPGSRPSFIRVIEDVPITQAPIVPVQIADREYRLWLSSKDNRVLDNNGEIELSVHFQQPPYGLDRVEYDNEGSVTGFWYKPTDGPELEYVREISSGILPKELQFDWYMAKDYSLKSNATNAISNMLSENVPPEITANLGDSNDFLLTILEKMQTELENKSA